MQMKNKRQKQIFSILIACLLAISTAFIQAQETGKITLDSATSEQTSSEKVVSSQVKSEGPADTPETLPVKIPIGYESGSLIKKSEEMRIPWIEIRRVEFGKSFLNDRNVDDLLNDSVLPEFDINQTSERSLDLNECLELAFLNSPDMMKAGYAVKQYEAQLRRTMSLYIPNASLILLRSDAGIPALNDNYWNNSITGEISYSLYDSGRRSQMKEAAGQSLEAARYSFLAAWNEKAYKVSTAYYNFLYACWVSMITEDTLLKTRFNLNTAQGFYTTGSKARVDVTQAEIQMRTAELNLMQSQTNILTAYNNLIGEIGIDSHYFKNRRPEELLTEKYVPVAVTRDHIIEVMLKENPTLAYYKSSQKASLDMAKYYLADRLPIFSANAAWGGKTNWGATDASWSVNFQLEIPLLKNTEAKANSDEQKAIAMQLKSDELSTEIALIEQIDSSIISIYSAIKRSETAYNSVETALLNYKLSFMRYKQGVSGIIELTNSIDFLNNARLQYVEALLDIRLQDAAIRYAVGYHKLPSIAPEKLQDAIDEYIIKQEATNDRLSVPEQ